MMDDADVIRYALELLQFRNFETQIILEVCSEGAGYHDKSENEQELMPLLLMLANLADHEADGSWRSTLSSSYVIVMRS